MSSYEARDARIKLEKFGTAEQILADNERIMSKIEALEATEPINMPMVDVVDVVS